MQKDLEDYHDLLALRQAKAALRNQQGRPFAAVAKELGLKKKKSAGLGKHALSKVEG